MSEETIATQVVEGNGADPPSQETSQATQVVPESQETTTNPVEIGSKEPQVPEVSRRKPSDYYRERQTIRELKETVTRLENKIQEKESLKPKPDNPEAPDFEPAHFSQDHKRILLAREKALRDAYDSKISALEQKLDGWQEGQKQAEVSRKHQEALELFFPKSSPESNETLEQRIKKNPERAERLRQFLIESGLNEASKVNPAFVMEIAMERLGERPKANPTVLKKNMMGATGTGNPGMGEKRGSSEQDLLSEKNKLNMQLETNPNLRHDLKFMERRAQILGEIERLVTKK